MLANSLDYYLLDVFTERAFAGNPLAVFPHAQGLDTRRMQAIANELNLSETVFVGQAWEVNRYPMRIFTPTLELPFAGHPTLGTAHLLAELELASREWPLTLEAGVGPLEVRFADGLARFTTARPVEVGTSTLDRATAAELLGLSESQVVGEPVLASCGLAYHLVELDSLEALERALPAPAPWTRSVSPSGVENIYLYVTTTLGQDNSLRARMFSMEGSLREDPATGSAAAALVGTLATRRPGVGKWQWRIDQGVEMGRPGRILGEVERDANLATAIRIAGQAVIVGQGALWR
ncbi:trans-2,3-dihydro-3-hydroxyanthranilate isomerase [Modicisalibacter muralis]|uniref:Trans-2,3-dihydro-3-hydroxyanthranilate isomerase n=1 Tax=Modicisalibacter muralis TaxID=119000 RepID=A0A1G9JH69_9GAMM|nr:PhzF family phenazine biosynthesis protein [Halomonas muralis]SDL36605.1 trans-2,3-dihydro-3-hydroxyanthranilate isomerase [Halomonas muralis]